MSPSIQFVDRFLLAGIIKSKKELTSQKNASWKGYCISVATTGATNELTVTEPMFRSLVEGENVLIIGEHETYSGKLRLNAQRIISADRVPALFAALDVIEAKDKAAQIAAIPKFQAAAAEVFAQK